MSKHIGFYYRCDRCGCESRPLIGMYDYYLPDGWQKFGKMHFCKHCAKRYKEITDE